MGFHPDYVRGTRDRSDPVYRAGSSAAHGLEVADDEVGHDELKR
jgi:hypothetical protein